MKLAAIQSSLGSFRRPLLALAVTMIFALALDSRIALSMEHGGVGGGAASPAEWVPYHNAATGLSFRYPASLRIRERDPRPFRVPEGGEVSYLVGDTATNPDTTVLRFLVKAGEMTPEIAARRARGLRENHANDTPNSRESLTPMQLLNRA